VIYFECPISALKDNLSLAWYATEINCPSKSEDAFFLYPFEILLLKYPEYDHFPDFPLKALYVLKRP
jgi:hypothetical protein